MKVKVKYKDILYYTEKCTLFLLKYENELWIPNSIFKYSKKQNAIFLDKWFAEKYFLDYDEYYHQPFKIEPKYNQTPIKELIYE